MDYENCKSRKKIVDKLVEECTETVEEVKIVENMHKCNSCILYIVLFSILLTINVGIGSYFFILILIYYSWKNNLLILASLNL